MNEQDALVDELLTLGHVHGRVVVAERVGLEGDPHRLGRHDREVFWSRDVLERVRVPDNDVFVLNVVLSSNPRADAVPSSTLVGVRAGGEELSILVLGDPDGVLAELGPFGVPGGRVGEQRLQSICRSVKVPTRKADCRKMAQLT